MVIKPKIIDVFSFNGELDLLEIRLNILNEVVDEFIICESDETFTGLPKPLYFEENRARYDKWKDKITYFLMSKPDEELLAQAQQSPGVPQHLHWWVREFCQKESMKRALTHLSDDDLVFIGDADEIWNPDVVIPNGRGKLEQLVYAYYLNNRSSEWWEGTSVIPYKYIKQDTLDNLRAHDTHREYMRAPTIPNGGWHFTNMGGVEFIKRKMNSYSHQEFNHPQITEQFEEQMKQNKDFIGRDFVFKTDESQLPKYILNNREKYAHLFR